MTGKKLIKNTILMTAFSVIMRVIGLGFQIFISDSIGASGVGLFQLVMSVHALAITVATSGVRFAVTRIVAEVIGAKRPQDIRSVVRCCFGYAAFFGALAFALVFFNSEYLALHWAGDIRTAVPIKILSLGLVFVSVTTVTGGYFTAVGRVGRAALIQLAEQAIMIVLTVSFLSAANSDMVQGCSAISAASVSADFIIFIISMLVFVFDVRRYGSAKTGRKYLSRLISISLPLAASAYARTVLSTLQHMFTPAGLKKSGASADEALAIYGSIHGMVFPVLVFPSALFTSLAELLIPELTEYQISGNHGMVNDMVNRILRLCLSFSLCCAAILFTFGREIGLAMYSSESVGEYIRLLSPLVIVMYMDTVTDGMLKGLGQQLYSMGINITDAAISLIMVFWLLPVYAIKAYIFIIFFSECFNFALSILRLASIAKIRLSAADFLRPLLCSLVAVNASLLIVNACKLTYGKTVLAFTVILSAAIYFLLLRIISPKEKRAVIYNK